MKFLLSTLFSALVGLSIATTGLAADAKADAAKGAPKGESKSADKIDINSASAKELMTIDGIGEARAAAIIKGRPYRGKDELVSKNIIPASVYEGLKDRVIARQKSDKKK